MGENEYQSREFCKDSNCHMQIKIENITEESGKEVLKEEHCREHCKAYQFHQWLKENDYKIVKGE